nr:hypothetical protein [Tanacetum cinerariifolium]
MGQTLADRIRMVYTGAEVQVLFTSHAWRRLFEIRGLLVREFILEFFSTCLHTVEEMAEDGFEAYCISGRGQATEKVTAIDLLYLRSMDQGTANVSYLLAQYLYRHAEGRKNGAKMSRGHFIGRIVEHFGLVSDEGLMGLSVIACVLLVIDLDELVKAPQPPLAAAPSRTMA